jgi:hypothetical protein
MREAVMTPVASLLQLGKKGARDVKPFGPCETISPELLNRRSGANAEA